MTRMLPALIFAGAVAAAGTATAAERTVTLAVKNMYCAACPYIVKRSLARVPGVAGVAVSFAKKTATVTYDDRQATLAKLTAATTAAGYPSAPVTGAAATN
jgi:mercuric ion binding protein